MFIRVTLLTAPLRGFCTRAVEFFYVEGKTKNLCRPHSRAHDSAFIVYPQLALWARRISPASLARSHACCTLPLRWLRFGIGFVAVHDSSATELSRTAAVSRLRQRSSAAKHCP